MCPWISANRRHIPPRHESATTRPWRFFLLVLPTERNGYLQARFNEVSVRLPSLVNQKVATGNFLLLSSNPAARKRRTSLELTGCQLPLGSCRRNILRPSTSRCDLSRAPWEMANMIACSERDRRTRQLNQARAHLLVAIADYLVHLFDWQAIAKNLKRIFGRAPVGEFLPAVLEIKQVHVVRSAKTAHFLGFRQNVGIGDIF